MSDGHFDQDTAIFTTTLDYHWFHGNEFRGKMAEPCILKMAQNCNWGELNANQSSEIDFFVVRVGRSLTANVCLSTISCILLTKHTSIWNIEELC